MGYEGAGSGIYVNMCIWMGGWVWVCGQSEKGWQWHVWVCVCLCLAGRGH